MITKEMGWKHEEGKKSGREGERKKKTDKARQKAVLIDRFAVSATQEAKAETLHIQSLPRLQNKFKSTQRQMKKSTKRG